MLAAAALFSAASCSQELVDPNEQVGSARVYTAEFDSAETKAMLSENTKTVWEPGDEIRIFDGMRSSVYAADIEANAPTATFVSADNVVLGNEVIAVSPAVAGESANADLESLEVGGLRLPTNQVARAGSYDPAASIAVAHSTNESLEFKNATALVKFRVKNDNVRSVRISSLGGEPLSGWSTYVFAGDDLSCENSGGYEYVEMAPEDGLFEVGRDYYISVLPNTLEQGFKIQFCFEGILKVVDVKSTSKVVTLKRNVILNIGELEYTGEIPKDTWGIIGDLNDWGGWGSPDEDLTGITMTEYSENLFVAYGVEFPEPQYTRGSQFRIMANADWTIPEGNIGLAVYGTITAGCSYDVINSVGNGAIVMQGGIYDIWFDYENMKLYFMNEGDSYENAVEGIPGDPTPVYGIVGDINGWGTTPDIDMEPCETSLMGRHYVARNVEFPADGAFKIRANGKWYDSDANFGFAEKGTVEAGHTYYLECHAATCEMAIAAGIYDIWIDVFNKRLYVMNPGDDIANATLPGSDIIDPNSLDKVWVIGDYCGWDHNKTQFLFDYDKDGAVYNGVVDFGDRAANGFKITGIAGWDDTCNWGLDPDVAVPEAEASPIQLMTSGGSRDINIYSKRFYNFEFDRSALTLSVKHSFDQLGVIGDFNSWADDVVMEYNPVYMRFYADIEASADGGLKVRADANWDLSWGADMGAGNFSVAAGNYRIYLDLNNNTIKADADMYGQMEPGMQDEPDIPENPDEPVVLEGWGVIGDFNNWTDGTDIMMTQQEAVWSVLGVELKAGQGWKIRKDGRWDNNRGATGDYNPFEVPLGGAVPVVADGQNFTVPADGTYDIYYDEGHEILYVLENGSAAPEFEKTWFMVGGFNGWACADSDYMMVKEGDFWVLRGFVLDSEQNMKFNIGSWDVLLGCSGEFTVNAAMNVGITDYDDIVVPAGTYDVYLDVVNNLAYFMTEGRTPADAGTPSEPVYIDASDIVVGLSGSFPEAEWTDPTGAYLAVFDSKNVTDENTFAGTYEYKLTAAEIGEGDEFKVRINGLWFGFESVTVEGLTGSDNNGNISVNDTGAFNITISFSWDGTNASDVKVIFTSKRFTIVGGLE